MKKILTVFIALIVAVLLAWRFSSDSDRVPVPAGSAIAPEPTTDVDSDPVPLDDDSGEADTNPADNSRPLSALEEKQRQTDLYGEMVTGITRSELDEQVAATKQAYYSGSSALSAHLTEMHTQVAEQYGEEEADFRLALVASTSDWDQMKNLVANREAVLGSTGQYDQLLLDMGVANGQISYEEIAALTSTGSVLPENAIYLLASQGRIDVIAQLGENNLLANPNFEQPFMGRNAIGALIQHATYFPDHYGSTEQIGAAVDALVNAGVAPMPSHGGLGPMDHALMGVSLRNFEVRYAIVKKLLEHGVPFEQSHMEIISALPDGSSKEELQRLLGEHM